MVDLPIVIPVAVVVPMFNTTPVAVSRVGVSTLVSACPVPEIWKLEEACRAVPFCIKLVAVGAKYVASQVLSSPVALRQTIVVPVVALRVTPVLPAMVVVTAALPILIAVVFVAFVPIVNVPAVARSILGASTLVVALSVPVTFVFFNSSTVPAGWIRKLPAEFT